MIEWLPLDTAVWPLPGLDWPGSWAGISSHDHLISQIPACRHAGICLSARVIYRLVRGERQVRRLLSNRVFGQELGAKGSPNTALSDSLPEDVSPSSVWQPWATTIRR